MGLARTSAVVGTAAAGSLAYGSLIERNAFTLRRFEIPVLRPGTEPIRVLHVSDLHITAGQHRKHEWIRGLAGLEPDFVINTGDTLSAADAMPAVLYALEPLFGFPGVRPGQQRLLRAGAEEPAALLHRQHQTASRT